MRRWPVSDVPGSEKVDSAAGSRDEAQEPWTNSARPWSGDTWRPTELPASRPRSEDRRGSRLARLHAGGARSGWCCRRSTPLATTYPGVRASKELLRRMNFLRRLLGARDFQHIRTGSKVDEFNSSSTGVQM